MKIHAIRLVPGEDLKPALESFLAEKKIRAGVVLSCVGSLTKVNLRFAGQSAPVSSEGKFEIVSMEATVSTGGCHIHISVADSSGSIKGGHLCPGSIVFTTAELVIGEIEELVFARKVDQRTGYGELDIAAADRGLV